MTRTHDRDAALWRECAPKWDASLNRRAEVEQLMLDAARGKRPMPSPEELRAWALRLGTPEEAELRAAVAPRAAAFSTAQIRAMAQTHGVRGTLPGLMRFALAAAAAAAGPPPEKSAALMRRLDEKAALPRLGDEGEA